MKIPNPSKPSLVTLAENEHSENRSASGTIPEAQRSGARFTLHVLKDEGIRRTVEWYLNLNT